MTTESVRSLQRGLAVLEYFNKWNRATVSDVTSAFKLPRGTVYRLLETLHRCGYLEKGHERGQYLVAAKVVELSCAFESEAWISRTVRPLLDHVAEDIAWPVLLVLSVGGTLRVKARSDARAAAFRREYPVGSDISSGETAAGLAFLAFSKAASSEVTIPQKLLRQIGRNGAAVLPEPDGLIVQVAVPVFVKECAVGALMARTDLNDEDPGAVSLVTAHLAHAAQKVAESIPKDYSALFGARH